MTIPTELVEQALVLSNDLFLLMVFDMHWGFATVRRQVPPTTFQGLLRMCLRDLLACNDIHGVYRLNTVFDVNRIDILLLLAGLDDLYRFEFWISALDNAQMQSLYERVLMYGNVKALSYLHESGFYRPYTLLHPSLYTNNINTLFDSLRWVSVPTVTISHIDTAVHANRLDILKTINSVTNIDLRREYDMNNLILAAQRGYLDMIKWFHDICVCQEECRQCIFSEYMLDAAETFGHEDLAIFLRIHTRCLHRTVNTDLFPYRYVNHLPWFH